MRKSYLNILVISIPTNITFTGNQTLINLHVSGSVDMTPEKLKIQTTVTETRFCNHVQEGITHQFSKINLSMLIPTYRSKTS